VSRGRPSKSQRITALGDFVRKLRKEKGWSQKELDEKLGLKNRPGYVSKIETGTLQKPDDDFFVALARLVAKPIDDLKELSARRFSPNPGASEPLSRLAASAHPYKIAFGHCIWGAPLVFAVGKGLIPQFETTSFADKDGPVFVNEGWMKGAMKVPGPFSPDPKLESLSANNVLRMLERGEVDLAAVPGNVLVDSRLSWLVRVATLVDSASGCSLVCDHSILESLRRQATKRSMDAARHCEESEDGVSAEDLGQLLVRQHEGDRAKHSRLALELGTVAEGLLRDALARIDAKKAADIWWNVVLPFSNSDLALENTMRVAREEYVKGNAGLGIITWEPHATWTVTFNPSMSKCPIHFRRGPNGRPTHLTFELVMRRDDANSVEPRSRELRLAIYRLVQHLGDCAERLNRIDTDSLAADQQAVVLNGQYFNLSKDKNGKHAEKIVEKPLFYGRDAYGDTISAIGGVRYAVHWASNEVLDLMGFRPS
jgi:transcriptional regulator with XRE-family HTH domain